MLLKLYRYPLAFNIVSWHCVNLSSQSWLGIVSTSLVIVLQSITSSALALMWAFHIHTDLKNNVICFVILKLKIVVPTNLFWKYFLSYLHIVVNYFWKIFSHFIFICYPTNAYFYNFSPWMLFIKIPMICNEK